ncbi:MAG: anthranilate phosphoribosyltransferase [Candidatus Latescibacteria bacterium]|jgi:anthranilate phosphoribosyltransferase|nr:anthranilate phosphoribosyltransferase [Candidatus Latescibacterota bacterium]MBT4139552.1 anthranilate phosphoribosyltransferase [Candidatus Latescibacterota bacterium]
MTIQEAIAKLIEGQNLARDEMTGVMNQIMSGDATDAQIGAFLIALRIKGESVDEIVGAASVMREKATPIQTKHSVIVDTCGTGGDHSGTFNISTTAAFVVAGAGLCVAKHGNRAATSKSGSADVLKALGVNIEASPETMSRCLDEVGIGFLFAVSLHGAMKYAIGPRREVGARTIFNALGPLTNPAGATRQVIGVYSPALTETLATVLGNLGSEHVFVVHGSDGLDEMTLTGSTRVSELKNGSVSTYDVSPEDVGLALADASDLAGGEADENAAMTVAVLNGEAGPKRDIVLLNAAAAIVAGGKASDLADGVKVAAEVIASGKALEKLEGLKTVSQGA